MRDDDDVIRVNEKKNKGHVIWNALTLDVGRVPVSPFAVYTLVGEKLLISKGQ